jgi:asparagine synthase (glutamine-hydrolysing)
MCRISGAYDPNNKARLKNVEEMVAFQIRGGPDGQGLYHHFDVSFGHNRLAVIDLTDEGFQPVEYLKRYALTYNGEWYNFKDYYPMLSSDSIALFESINDVGINDTLQRLNGMFAFAVHDKQEQEIHLAVDRFAQKPLYYYHKGNTFYFASWPAALYDQS